MTLPIIAKARGFTPLMVKRMNADPGLGKTYAGVDQMMDELLANVSCEADLEIPEGFGTEKEAGL